MKKLDKAEMLKRGQVEHVKAERNVLAEVHNPYVVKLFYSFQVPDLLTAQGTEMIWHWVLTRV